MVSDHDLYPVGAEWLVGEITAMVDCVEHLSPVEFIERFRYLSQGQTPRPGYLRFSLFPFWREVLNCYDPWSPVREVNVLKGAQVGFTVSILESIILYYIGYIKTHAGMFLTADKDLATGRMENSILPMLNESGFDDCIRSADIGNKRKTGKTKDYLQWDGGGSLIFNGAQNAIKMRDRSVPLMLKDELDGWPRVAGKDGNSDALTDARLAAYWLVRKILRGSTPLTKPSMIYESYLRGDQRKYLILCKACSFPQELKHRKPDTENGVIRGFQWETESDKLILESVRYHCADCGHEHLEHDKEFIFAEENGASWVPTAQAREPGIRSYHLPAFYSPFGFRPWYKCIADFLGSYDPVAKQTRSIGRYQEYVNNTLGMPFEVDGRRVRFRSVSSHRRVEYSYGQVPNKFAAQHAGSRILFLTCQVDVHKRDLAVSVMGWAKDSRPFLIDYWRFDRRDEKDDCGELTSPVWERLRGLIEDKVYVADDGQKYGIALTAVDAGYANDTVVTFCSDWFEGVYPILGRQRPAKNQTIKEFSPFKTQAGGPGYKITVDHYKDRMASVLRRHWEPELNEQPKYHFNAPVDTTDAQLKELTVERRQEDTDPQGNTFYSWHRRGNAHNELWDLLGYGYAIVEILAWGICIENRKMEKIDWTEFWNYAMDKVSDGLLCRLK